MLPPLVVLVTGDRDEELLRAAHTLRVALPDVTVRAQVQASQSLREASATSHLVVDVAERERPPKSHELVDATVRSPSDLERFVRRVRDFDPRRRLHELPPDLPPSITPWSPRNVQRIAPDAPGVRSDNPRGRCTDSDQWEKRLYAGVDDTQRTIVHVRRVGAANWRYALLFRDWLRSNDDRRDAYAQVKANLATEHRSDTNFDAYARAKDYWFDYAYNESEAWAQATEWDPRSFGSDR